MAETNQGNGEGSSVTTPAAPKNGKRRRTSLIIFVGFLLVGAVVGAWYYVSTMGTESTDDAFIAANVYRIAPKVEGRLGSVAVKDNQVVEAGAPLAEIEAADYEARAEQARAALDLSSAQVREASVQVGITEASTAAALDQAKAELQAAEARRQQEQAGLESAQAEAGRAKADFERYSKLSEKAVSPQRLDVVRSAATTADAQVRAAQKRIASADADVTAAQSRIAAAEAAREKVAAARAEVERRNAEVKQAEALLREAELHLSYVKIAAPAAGRITSKAALPGDFVKAGQSLMMLVSSDVWVVANFKETQLKDMRPGQAVTIHVDAYGADFAGHIDSIQSGSGAQFSLLPPQNATGNYVKIVQRVPVKIVFDQIPDPARFQLGPGMSVLPRVRVK